MREKPRLARRLALLLVFLAAIAVVAGGPAVARASAGSDGQDAEYTSQEVAANELTAPELKTDQTVSDYLDDQADLGRNLDLQQVNASDLGDSTVVWEDGVQVDGVVSDGSDSAEGLGVTLHETKDAQVAPSLPSGMGMDSLTNTKNLKLISGTCTTVSAWANQATSCYQKFKATSDPSSTYDYYDYNRWGSGDPRYGGHVTEVTIRSKPWTGQALSGMTIVNYFPKKGGNVCTQEGSVNGGFNLEWLNFSATVPIEECTQQDMSVKTSASTTAGLYNIGMMSQWLAGNTDGSIVTEATQFNFVMRVYQGQVPVMADYIWSTYVNPDGSSHATGWADTGWPS